MADREPPTAIREWVRLLARLSVDDRAAWVRAYLAERTGEASSSPPEAPRAEDRSAGR